MFIVMHQYTKANSFYVKTYLAINLSRGYNEDFFFFFFSSSSFFFQDVIGVYPVTAGEADKKNKWRHQEEQVE